MAARREENGTWSTSFRYSDWEGKSRLKHARGFKEEAEADAFERDFKRMASSKSGMPFEVFAEKYLEDIEPRVRPTTYDVSATVIIADWAPASRQSRHRTGADRATGLWPAAPPAPQGVGSRRLRTEGAPIGKEHHGRVRHVQAGGHHAQLHRHRPA